jgi:hypothetical protein
MSSDPAIIDVSAWPREDIEQMGSKAKFWCRSPVGNQLWLFKFSRRHSGEDWSETVAAQIAGALDIPHAQIALAVCDGQRGSLSRNFVDENEGCQLVHGNELLFHLDPNYPKGGPNFHLAQHTLERIFDALDWPAIQFPRGWSAPAGVEMASDLFVG